MAAKKIKIQQVASPIKRIKTQRATLKGLGLDKMHKTSEIIDSPQVRGMIETVKHLVKVVG